MLVQAPLEIHGGPEQIRNKRRAESARECFQSDRAAVGRHDDLTFLDGEILQAHFAERLPILNCHRDDRFGRADIQRCGEFRRQCEQVLRELRQLSDQIETDRWQRQRGGGKINPELSVALKNVQTLHTEEIVDRVQQR